MTKTELRDKLIAAQNLLSEVYDFASANSSLDDLERTVSAADTCIFAALDAVRNMKE